MKKQICELCGNEFDSKYSKKTCSQECLSKIKSVNNTKMLVKQLEKKCGECDLKAKIETQDREYIALAQKLVALQNESTETISKLKLEVMLKAEEIEKLEEHYDIIHKCYEKLVENYEKSNVKIDELIKYNLELQEENEKLRKVYETLQEKYVATLVENTELKKQLSIINRRTFLQEMIHRIRLKINPFYERGNKNV